MMPGDRVTIEAVVVGVHWDAPEQFITDGGTLYITTQGEPDRIEVAIKRVAAADSRHSTRIPRGVRVHEIDLVN